ncbi:MAG TPA: hypothetical protein QGF58_20155 [Myxococcota bacterium]|nr:hypothetical protein [Myxococcota bacterium]
MLILGLSLSCSDYSYFNKNDATEPWDSGGNPGVGDDSGGDDSGGGGGDPSPDPWDDYDDPPDGDPPDRFGDCDEGIESVSEDTIYVLSWDPTEMEGSITAPAEGWYHIYSDSIAESGGSQRNESAFFRVENASNPSGVPRWANCGYEWIVQDADNDGFPGGSRIYIGTFWLDEGDNDLVMHHYCPLYRSGNCPTFHIEGEAQCDSSNVNSVHYYGTGICITMVK